MITKQSHPYIYNTLESNAHWRFYIKQGEYVAWWACLQYNDEDSEAASGESPTEAADRLEAVLQGSRESLDELTRITEDMGLYDPDPEQTAYLERWEGAPEEAAYLAQDPPGDCYWYRGEPVQSLDGRWVNGGVFEYAGYNIFGSPRCEPRPTQSQE